MKKVLLIAIVILGLQACKKQAGCNSCSIDVFVAGRQTTTITKEIYERPVMENGIQVGPSLRDSYGMDWCTFLDKYGHTTGQNGSTIRLNCH